MEGLAVDHPLGSVQHFPQASISSGGNGGGGGAAAGRGGGRGEEELGGSRPLASTPARMVVSIVRVPLTARVVVGVLLLVLLPLLLQELRGLLGLF